MNPRVLRCLTFASFVLGVSSLTAAPATQPASSPTTTKSNKVVVDVVVTDEADQPVKGLHVNNFSLFEDRAPQEILSFKFHDHEATPAAAEPLPLPLNTFSNATTSPRSGINVVLLDQLNTSLEDQQLARHELIRFLKEKPDNAAFAIFALRNDEVACQPANQQLMTAAPNVPALPPDAGCAKRGTLLLVSGITENRDRLIASLDNDQARPHQTSLRPSVGMHGPRRNNYSTGPGEVYDTSMASLAEIGNFLQRLPGRKNLIWMSDNFDAAPVAQVFEIWFPPKFKGWESTDPFSPVQMTHLTAGRLSAARVAIYPVDLNGKNKEVEIKRLCMDYRHTVPFYQDDHICDEHLISLNTLAAESGGRSFHGPDSIQDAFTIAVLDGSTYYSLAYSPTKATFDGKSRGVNVTLNKKSYHLAYRKHYYADDPDSLNRPEMAASYDLYLPRNNGGPVPWKVVRAVDSNTAQPDQSKEPILAGLRYGAPEAHDIVFTSHVDATGKSFKASDEQMEQLQQYASFRLERMDRAMRNLTPEEQKTQRKGRTVVNELPPSDPVFLQPYTIDCSFSPMQLNLKPGADGATPIHLEIAILAYDATGAKVTGAKSSVNRSIPSSELAKFQASDYHVQLDIDVPERATLMRVAVRDTVANKIGSIEIPVWAISSPNVRQRLKLPDPVD
jgi:VWFA-related protein